MTGGMVLWRAGCGGSRTSGSEGGPGKRTGRKARTAPWSRPYAGAFACSRIGLRHIERPEFERVEGAMIHELDLAFFEDRFEGAAPTEQALLLAMGRAGGRATLAEIAREAGDGVNAAVGLRRLIDKGLVYRPTRATYDFALPLFAGYLRRRAKVTGLS